jgi:uncharacterized membrane protein (DUF4010 family)
VKTAVAGAVVVAVLLIPLAVHSLVRRYKTGREVFDVLTEAEATNEHAVLTVLPNGYTCGRCGENPALPRSAWCAVCAPIVDQYPSEPIERGSLR